MKLIIIIIIDLFYLNVLIKTVFNNIFKLVMTFSTFVFHKKKVYYGTITFYFSHYDNVFNFSVIYVFRHTKKYH